MRTRHTRTLRHRAGEHALRSAWRVGVVLVFAGLAGCKGVGVEVVEELDAGLDGGASPEWVVGAWSACTAPCGGGSQTRTVSCPTPTGADCEAQRPSDSQACNAQLCGYTWVAGDEGPCSVPCGTGVQATPFECKRSDGQTVADALCPQPKPPESRSCTRSCDVYAWRNVGFGACSVSCGNGEQAAQFECTRGDGQPVAESFCSQPKPQLSRVCSQPACVPCGSRTTSTCRPTDCDSYITNATQLAAIHSGSSANNRYCLANDLCLQGQPQPMLASSLSGIELNGCGFHIDGLSITRQPLLPSVSNSRLRNLVFDAATVTFGTTPQVRGFLAGNVNNTRIEDLRIDLLPSQLSSGSASQASYCGVVAGNLSGVIERAVVTGSSLTSTSCGYVGGLVGVWSTTSGGAQAIRDVRIALNPTFDGFVVAGGAIGRLHRQGLSPITDFGFSNVQVTGDFTAGNATQCVPFVATCGQVGGVIGILENYSVPHMRASGLRYEGAMTVRGVTHSIGGLMGAVSAFCSDPPGCATSPDGGYFTLADSAVAGRITAVHSTTSQGSGLAIVAGVLMGISSRLPRLDLTNDDTTGASLTVSGTASTNLVGFTAAP